MSEVLPKALWGGNRDGDDGDGVGSREGEHLHQSSGEAGQLICPRSVRMRRLLDRARELAFGDRPLLLHGERGSGKSLLARMIHDWGRREGEAFVSVSCRGVDAEKLRRAVMKAGRLAEEHNRGSDRGGGTVVLDEIGMLPESLLSEVMGVLRRRSQVLLGMPIGGAKLRVIGVTRMAVNEICPMGAGDSVTVLGVPPLRERREDIVVMAERFLRRKGEEDGRRGLMFTVRARHALGNYDWPGNVRELRSVAERAAVMSAGLEVDVAELALPQRNSGLWPEGYPSLEELERVYIERVVRESPTLEAAARVLGVDITTLWRKRRRYGI